MRTPNAHVIASSPNLFEAADFVAGELSAAVPGSTGRLSGNLRLATVWQPSDLGVDHLCSGGGQNATSATLRAATAPTKWPSHVPQMSSHSRGEKSAMTRMTRIQHIVKRGFADRTFAEVKPTAAPMSSREGPTRGLLSPLRSRLRSSIRGAAVLQTAVFAAPETDTDTSGARRASGDLTRSSRPLMRWTPGRFVWRRRRDGATSRP